MQKCHYDFSLVAFLSDYLRGRLHPDNTVNSVFRSLLRDRPVSADRGGIGETLTTENSVPAKFPFLTDISRHFGHAFSTQATVKNQNAITSAHFNRRLVRIVEFRRDGASNVTSGHVEELSVDHGWVPV